MRRLAVKTNASSRGTGRDRRGQQAQLARLGLLAHAGLQVSLDLPVLQGLLAQPARPDLPGPSDLPDLQDLQDLQDLRGRKDRRVPRVPR